MTAHSVALVDGVLARVTAHTPLWLRSKVRLDPHEADEIAVLIDNAIRGVVRDELAQLMHQARPGVEPPEPIVELLRRHLAGVAAVRRAQREDVA